MSQWRKFMFFEKDLLNIGDGSEVISGGVDEKESDKNLMVFSEGEGSITCCTSGRGKLYFGSSQGIIALVDRSQRKKTFEAHDKNVMFLKHVRSKNLLISIGNDEDITNASIKIWRLDNVDSSSTALPVHARTIKPFSSKFPEAPITCFTCLDDITQIVLGMGDGSIMLINGDLIRDRGRTTRLLQNRGPCVTNCFFVEVPGEERKNKEPENWLFVTTLSSVMTYYTSNLNDITMTVLDESTGCELNCATLAENRTLAVATPLAVFFFFHNERGGVYGFDDIKKSVYSFNNYLVLINEDRRMPGKNIVNIYDLGNQFIAYNGKFANVVGVISEWASIFIVTSSGFVFRLSEKDLHGKIEMLFKRNLFDIAINLAKSQNLASRDLAEIFKEYGDHLYGKGDYDRAVAQYIETIRDGKTFIEPSYVIRKFLDAQRIDNLTNYLEALHHNKCANKDHTTLLLNCFTKSKEIQKLDAFIKESTAAKFQDGQVPNFDVETAINVCRQAQYFEHALQLSQVHRKDEWHVKLLIEDMNKYAEAIDFLRSLDVLDAEQFVKKYGQELMLNQPGLTTELLKQICTDPRPSKIKSNERAEEVLIRARPEEFIHIYVERSE